jgi:hypothetical protein
VKFGGVDIAMLSDFIPCSPRHPRERQSFYLHFYNFLSVCARLSRPDGLACFTLPRACHLRSSLCAYVALLFLLASMEEAARSIPARSSSLLGSEVS